MLNCEVILSRLEIISITLVKAPESPVDNFIGNWSTWVLYCFSH